MKKLLVAIIAMMGMTASAATLTGKISNYNSGSKAKVCMNRSCTSVGSDGSYSLNVITAGITSVERASEPVRIYTGWVSSW